MKKMIFILTLMLISILPFSVYAQHFQSLPIQTEASFSGVRIEERILDGKRVGGIIVRGAVPDIEGSDELADEVDRIFGQRVNGGLGTARFSYNIVTSNRVVSIIILSEVSTHGGSRANYVDTINVDRITLEPISVQSPNLLGANGFAVATDVVNNFIAQNFRNMPRISTLDEDSSFYVANGAVHFVFARYEIAPGSEGVQSVAVYLNNIYRYTLGAGDYEIDALNHGVRMLPLRRVAEALGHRVSWNHFSPFSIDVVRANGNGDEVIPLRLNHNSYMRAQDSTPRTLEAAPQMINGITYVPISFFEIILGMHYHISADGMIELTFYRNY